MSMQRTQPRPSWIRAALILVLFATPGMMCQTTSMPSPLNGDQAGPESPGGGPLQGPDPSDTPPANAVTVTLKQGVNGYSGAKAANISSLSAAPYNGYNGTTFTDSVDWCIGDLPAQSYSISPLMRFEGLHLPSGARVISASLTCVFDSQTTGQKVVGHYLMSPWADSADSGGAGVGWVRRDTGMNWGAAGARAEGVDVVAAKSFAFGDFAATGWQSRTTSLDPAVVQAWVSDPSSNYGVVLAVDLPDHHTGFRQPQNDHMEDRPELRITYVLD